MSDPLLTIGGLARRAGVATSALRYWEELGLLPAPARISGQRRYPASAAGHIGVILLLRDAGFTLAEQKAFMASHAAAPGDWQQLARRKRAELDDQIANAQTAREAIDHALRCRTKTSSNAPPSPASSPPASPASRSTKPTRTSRCTPRPARGHTPARERFVAAQDVADRRAATRWVRLPITPPVRWCRYFAWGGQAAGLVVVQAQGGFEGGNQLGLFLAAGKRAGADQLATPGELAAAGAGEHATAFDAAAWLLDTVHIDHAAESATPPRRASGPRRNGSNLLAERRPQLHKALPLKRSHPR